MPTRLVRKWKVKSAAWAGIAAACVTGPLAYALLVFNDTDVPRTPGAVVATAETAPGKRPGALPPPSSWPRQPMDRPLEVLVTEATSTSADLRVKTVAVAQIGQVPGPAAVRALTTLARVGRSGEEPNFVSLAAMNALWARGERELVKELADASADPAVKSKAIALAETK